MSKLLISETPLQVLPALATRIGLNEAIILQQIHFLTPHGKDAAGHRWTMKSATDWEKIFPFWSAPTIRRALANLRTTGLVQTGSFNKAKYDKTIWWRVDYAALDELEVKPYDQSDHRVYDQSDQKRGDQSDQTNTLKKTIKEEEEKNKTFWTSPRKPLTRKGGKPYPAEEGTTDPSAILVAKMQGLFEQPKGLINKYRAAAGIDALGESDRETITAWVDHYQAKLERGELSRDQAVRFAYAAIRDANPAPAPIVAVTVAMINQPAAVNPWADFMAAD